MWRNTNNVKDQVMRQFYNQRRKRTQNIKQHNLLKKNVSYFQQLQQNYQQSQIMVPHQTENQQTFNQQTEIQKQKQNVQKNINPQQYGGLQRRNNYFSEYQLRRNYNYAEQPIPTFGTIHQQNNEQEYTNITTRDRSFSNPFKKITETFKDENKQNFEINDFRKTKKNSQNMRQKYQDNTQIQLQEQRKKKETFQEERKQQKNEYNDEYIKELQSKVKFQEKFIQSIQKMRKAIEKVDENCSLKQLWRWIKKLPEKQLQSNFY